MPYPTTGPPVISCNIAVYIGFGVKQLDISRAGHLLQEMSVKMGRVWDL